jgi:dTDP-4-dehydrorhamnose 3,5-epimerase
MKVDPTPLAGVLVIEPRVFTDARGCFFESFNHRTFAAAVGSEVEFVQDNHSLSRGPVLRGLHYQVHRPQGKLVRVVAGTIFDVAVDIRPDSPTCGKWFGLELSADNRRQIWIPPGLAHGLLVTSAEAEVLYKTTDYYDPTSERCIHWRDPTLHIAWPLTGEPIISAKDAAGVHFDSAALR